MPKPALILFPVHAHILHQLRRKAVIKFIKALLCPAGEE